MTPRYKIGSVMLASVALGALVGEALHGEARPPAYLIGQIDVSDSAGYAKEYLPRARRLSRRTVGVSLQLQARLRPAHRWLPSMERPRNVLSSTCIRAWRRSRPGEMTRHTCRCAPLVKNMPNTIPLRSRAPPAHRLDRRRR